MKSMMKKTLFVMSCAMLLAVGANAALITNGDFETGGDWRSDLYTTQPVGWYSPMCEAKINGHYGESIANLTDRPALMKSTGLADNYYQQVLSGVDAGTTGSYTVGFDYGVRHHSSYATLPGDSYTLRVSLWDTTADTELAWTSVEMLYPEGYTDNNFLTSTSEALTYDNSSLAGNELALRFTNTTAATGGNIGHKTLMFDNVVVASDAILPVCLVTPSNGEPSVSINANPTLEWQSGTDPDIIQHVLYFDTDFNWVANALPTDAGAIVLDVTTETYLHDEFLAYETTYYWRVDEATGPLSNPAKVETGPVWSFTTRPAPLPPCAGLRFDGDIDGDCFVDMTDLLLLAQDWMLTSTDSLADIDEDTNVDLFDFAFIGRDWQTFVNTQNVMIISAHPDDEGIFFGGAIPYCVQVLKVPTVHISTTSGDWNRIPEIREAELTNADTIYYGREITASIGLPPDTSADLFFPRFKDAPTSTIDGTWDWWYDGVLDGDDVALGKEKAIDTVATYIRVFQPEVIATHDLDGEYGHNNHKATAIAVVEAYDRAADPGYVDGYEPWQTKKLYIHQSEANGLGTSGYTFIGWLFHDFWEDYTIDTDGDEIADMTPRQVADLGLDEHISQGRPDVSTVYRTDENFNGHHSEWWGLLRSTVGPDTIAAPFTIMGKDYNDGTNDNWAIGNFFENVGPTN